MPQATRLGPVHLRVTDIPAALIVWRDTLGLAVLGEDAATAELGAGGRKLIVLHAGAQIALPQKSRDLFHVAIHVTSRRDLAHTAARLKASGLRYSAQDHLVSESLYVSDPSGNGIEICFDTPERCLRREVSADGRVALIAPTAARIPGSSRSISRAFCATSAIPAMSSRGWRRTPSSATSICAPARRKN
ncbi:VOC family protein [Mesorhizobium sp.]|uniref:VOC family protein n=1 Tax=Mesorhizobium sp. TaxID=1871066 RepID=UPI0025C73332|nr:VOC family protein [Mesorhizobium sp.]